MRPWRRRWHAPEAAFAEGRIVVARELERELAAHFHLPLLDEGWRHKHEDGARQASHAKLGENEACLDGLSEAHLIAEESPSAEPPQDRLRGADLMLEDLHVAQGWKADHHT